MKAAVILGAFLAAISTGPSYAAMGAGHGPQSSWNQMQKFEYYVGDLAGALNLCRRQGLYIQLREIAVLTPYGRKGMDAWLSYDGVQGCPGLSNQAEEVLEDKEKLIDYLKTKYDCSSGHCVER